MKSKSKPQSEKPVIDAGMIQTIPIARAKEIIDEEGIAYTDEELKEVLQLVSKVVSITTCHYERLKQKEARIININTITTHETTSLPLHPCQHRRAS
jgi:hypothetical protein